MVDRDLSWCFILFVMIAGHRDFWVGHFQVGILRPISRYTENDRQFLSFRSILLIVFINFSNFPVAETNSMIFHCCRCGSSWVEPFDTF